MCAGVAGQRGRSVLVLEQARHPGEKIRISGGGRCNFTNLHTSPANFLSDNPRFCRSALSGYTQHDFIALVESYGIAWHEKTRGQLFCDGSSRQIIDMLLEECRKAHAQLRLGVRISAVSKGEDGFVVVDRSGRVSRPRRWWWQPAVPQFRKWDRADSATRSRNSSALTIVTPRPALVPLTFDAALLAQFKDLVGRLGRRGRELRQGAFRRGAAVHPSRVERSGDPADLVLLARGPGHRHRHGAGHRRAGRAETIARRSSEAGNGHRAFRLASEAARIGHCRCGSAGPERLADFSDKLLAEVAAAVQRWRVRPAGTEGYRTAEVTLGGVDTSGLSSKTFESRSVPGLYFIGEVVDVTGHLGGFNFQWAWSSGEAAGRHV